jgi:hypothetical protein
MFSACNTTMYGAWSGYYIYCNSVVMEAFGSQLHGSSKGEVIPMVRLNCTIYPLT